MKFSQLCTRYYFISERENTTVDDFSFFLISAAWCLLFLVGSCIFEDHWQNSLDWQSETAQFYSCLPGWRDRRLRWQAWRHCKLYGVCHTKMLHMHKYFACYFYRTYHSLIRSYQSPQFIVMIIYFSFVFLSRWILSTLCLVWLVCLCWEMSRSNQWTLCFACPRMYFKELASNQTCWAKFTFSAWPFYTSPSPAQPAQF